MSADPSFVFHPEVEAAADAEPVADTDADADADTAADRVADPDPEYSYGGFTVKIDPIPGTDRRWRVTSLDDGDEPRYFGEVATADPVNGEVGVHYASHFPGEEGIPPTTVGESWAKSVQFLIDAKD